jgi:outer membrane protein assembly factor BamB
MNRLMALSVLLCVLAAGSADSADAPLKDILAAGGSAGVCVHLGCGEGKLTAELAQGGTLLVHALDADEKSVLAARQFLEQRKLYGIASVEQWAQAALPYAENLVNVLVAEKPGSTSDEEIMRVLAPNGTAFVQRNGAWKVLKKSWPKELDEWTHWRHGADGNMVSRDSAITPPNGLRWVAGPAQDAGGKKWYYDHVLVSSNGRNYYVFDASIAARDSFNGRLLWTREIKTPIFKEASVAGTRTSKVRPVAVGNSLYAIVDGSLVKLDGKTGETATTIAAVSSPREIIYEGGRILVTDATGIHAYDLDGKLAWERTDEVKRVVVGDNHVHYIAGRYVVSLDLKSGEERWRTEEPKAETAGTLSYYGGVLALERSTWKDDPVGTGIVFYSGETGKALWSKDYKPGMTHFQESRAFFAGGLVWLEGEKSKCTGHDPLTGKEMKQWNSRGLHCAAPVATEKFLIAPELEFTELETGKQNRARMVKSACRIAFVPANGLLYTFPVQCECFPMLRGYIGLAQSYGVDVKAPRLVSYGAAPKQESRADEWPMYRHDVYRSNGTSGDLRGYYIQQLWETQLAVAPKGLLAQDWKDNPYLNGILTQPVAAGGLVLLAVPDQHTLLAVDAKSGQRRWSYIAGGRIDTPPTIHEGLAIFGAHDGEVYALSLNSGELVWKFRAAPQAARIMIHGQMESVWPVAGSVLAEKGRVYFVAGRHPASDGGVHVYALSAHNGEQIWHQTVQDTGITRWYGQALTDSKIKTGVDYEPIDLLVKDGDTIAMSRWQFKADTGEFKLLLEDKDYDAAGLNVPRGVWGYGIRQTKMVQSRPPAVFDSHKIFTGQKGQTALVLANENLIAVSAEGEVSLGEQKLELKAAPIHDGMICAYGNLYVVTSDGRLVCFGAH